MSMCVDVYCVGVNRYMNMCVLCKRVDVVDVYTSVGVCTGMSVTVVLVWGVCGGI